MKGKKIIVTIILLVLVIFNCIVLSSGTGRTEHRKKTEYSICTSRMEEYKISESELGMSACSSKPSEWISMGCYSINDLRKKFPAGKFWNHEGNPNCNDPDSVTSSPCHNTNYDPSCCNIYSYGAQCHGYALRLSYLYNNVLTETYGISHDINDLRVGDVVRYRCGNYDHTIFITEISGNNVKFSDCNYDLRCGIRWDISTTKTQLSQLISATLHYVYDYPGQYSTTGFILSYNKRTIKTTKEIKECNVEVSSVVLPKNETKPKIKITDNGKMLVENTDYYISGSSKGINNGTVYISGMGKYTGKIGKEYEIVWGKIDQCNIRFTDGSNGRYQYTGSEIKPQIELTDIYGNKVNGSDLTVTYEKKPVGAGKHDIYIEASSGSKKYTGYRTVEYEILPIADIKDCSIAISSVVLPKNETTPKVNITYNEKELVEYTDYVITGYSNDTNKGTVYISGRGNYYGEIGKEYEIIWGKIDQCSVLFYGNSDGKYLYTGGEIRPEIRLTDIYGNGISGRDLKVTYEDNPVEAGIHKINIQAAADSKKYKGELTVEYEILPVVEIEDCDIEVSSVLLPKNEKFPIVKITYNDKALVENTDYRITGYAYDAEKGSVFILGRGCYKGTVTKEYDIIWGKIDQCSVRFADGSDGRYEYTGSEIKPQIELTDVYGNRVDGAEVEVTYEDKPVEPGKYMINIRASSDSRKYKGVQVIEYEVLPVIKELSVCKIDYQQRAEFIGKPVCPEVKIKDGSRLLVEGKDFTVLYRNNEDIGTGIICIHGIGNYSGNLEKEFQIYPEEGMVVIH